MLKVKNFLMLGLLTVAVALFVPACSESEEEEEELEVGYSITLTGGTMILKEDGSNIPSGAELIYENDDVIIELSATPEPGERFAGWEVSPSTYASRFTDATADTTEFTMPAANVTIIAVFEPIPVDGVAEVRFTWEAAENEKITHVSASVEDMEWWYDEVYADLENSDADFTDEPFNFGNPGVTEKIFEYGSDDHPNKGKYWSTEAGEFTAVCGVEDEYGLAEIVANYTIRTNPATATTDGKDLYFEIAFDVGTFLSEPDMDEFAWFQDETEDPTKGPRLEKKKVYKVGITRVATRQYKKPGATVDVTYYVIRRPKV
jgi:hypothetical protein